MKQFVAITLCLVLLAVGLGAIEERLSREILVLCTSTEDSIENEWAHVIAEMPLNHLGFVLRYHDVSRGLPVLSSEDGIHGVLTCFTGGTHLEDPLAYLEWASSAIDLGKKVVIMGDPGFLESASGKTTSQLAMNRFFRRLGLHSSGHWITLTYDHEIADSDPDLVGFERAFEDAFSPYLDIKVDDRRAKSHFRLLRYGEREREVDLVVTSDTGGYVAEGYFLHFVEGIHDKSEHRQWYINPFEFFRRVFGADRYPKPDVTTLAGRRIYYSHIDGDGWNNLSQIEHYREKPTLASEVILREAIVPYPDLPVTLAPIAADVDLEWVGSTKGIDIARRFFSLPHVEAGSHSYSHPFFWAFFRSYDPERERPYLENYRFGRWDRDREEGWQAALGRLFEKEATAIVGDGADGTFTIPRAYANFTFDLNQEIYGSVEKVQELLPEGRSVACYMWSGNTLPFEGAVRMTREAGLVNINGGDTRFDGEFPSYAWVPPIGRQVGRERVIYASNSNENTYTELWRDRFYGFRFLTTSLQRTGTPRRIKPSNVYYHLYSGEREASLGAVLHNLNYIRKQEVVPLKTSDFLQVTQGFYSTTIDEIGERRWRISERKGLQTIRFDHASTSCVDWEHSRGVVGQRYCQGSLYVYLDADVDRVVVSLKDNDVLHRYPSATVPYLIQSRWPVWGCTRELAGFSFQCSGFGVGEMRWAVEASVHYRVAVVGAEGYRHSEHVTSDSEGNLLLSLEGGTAESFTVHLEREAA